MQANNRDAGSLWDMLQAIDRIQEFTANLTYDAFLESVLLQSAVEYPIAVIISPPALCLRLVPQSFLHSPEVLPKEVVDIDS
jgi:hypothetical protein